MTLCLCRLRIRWISWRMSAVSLCRAESCASEPAVCPARGPMKLLGRATTKRLIIAPSSHHMTLRSAQLRWRSAAAGCRSAFLCCWRPVDQRVAIGAWLIPAICHHHHRSPRVYDVLVVAVAALPCHLAAAAKTDQNQGQLAREHFQHAVHDIEMELEVVHDLEDEVNFKQLALDKLRPVLDGRPGGLPGAAGVVAAACGGVAQERNTCLWPRNARALVKHPAAQLSLACIGRLGSSASLHLLDPWCRPEPRRDFFLSLAFAAQRGGSKMLREAGKRRRDRRADGRYATG
eukprot:COSAG04_NODE_1071_length_8472_cov_5.953661_6_plen_289_part_01